MTCEMPNEMARNPSPYGLRPTRSADALRSAGPTPTAGGPDALAFAEDPLDDHTMQEDLPGEGEDDAVQLHPVVKVLTGLDAGRVWRLEADVNVVGRGGAASIVLPDDGVSRRHCVIALGRERRVAVHDLSSTNGTRVNDEPIGDRVVHLVEGDRIQLGQSVTLKLAWQHPLEEDLEIRLYRSAVRDPLTGLYNRRYLLDRLGQEMAWAARKRRPLSLAMIDVDHFKRVNDCHGHEAGDRVLRRVAERVEAECRTEDVLARVGGEEFVLVMRETTLPQARAVAERIRRAIAAQPVAHGAARIAVTASIGLACSLEPEIRDPADLLVAADRNLYRAKRAGRDTVRWTEESLVQAARGA